MNLKNLGLQEENENFISVTWPWVKMIIPFNMSYFLEMKL